MGSEESLADILPIDNDTGVKAEVFIAAQIGNLYLMSTSQEGFGELMGLPRKDPFPVAMPVHLRRIDPDDPHGQARSEDRRHGWKGEGAGIAIIAAMKQDDLFR